MERCSQVSPKNQQRETGQRNSEGISEQNQKKEDPSAGSVREVTKHRVFGPKRWARYAAVRKSKFAPGARERSGIRNR